MSLQMLNASYLTNLFAHLIGACHIGFEALLVNHPTGVMSMRSNPSLPPVNVTIAFTGRIPNSVSVRRVDATHANALPAYQASKFCSSHSQKKDRVERTCAL